MTPKIALNVDELRMLYSLVTCSSPDVHLRRREGRRWLFAELRKAGIGVLDRDLLMVLEVKLREAWNMAEIAGQPVEAEVVEPVRGCR